MLIRALLSVSIIAFSVIAALCSGTPAKVGPQVRSDIRPSPAQLPKAHIVDHTFFFTEGETNASACSPATSGISC